MPAKLTVHVPGDAVHVRVVADDAQILIGRDATCDLVVNHDSVSRQHARLKGAGDGSWQLDDLDSKNGIRVDGQREAQVRVRQPRWFAIGDVMCQFEPIDAAAATNMVARASERRQSSVAWSQRLGRSRETRDLIGDLLDGIVEVAECKRGFLLALDRDGQLRMRACYAMAPEHATRVSFSGSRSAVNRVINERRAVYLSDHRDHAWLRDRASVIAGDIRALVCLPLIHVGRLMGVAYADTSDAAKIFTDLDADLLAAFVDHASAALALAEIDANLNDTSFWLAISPAGRRDGDGPAPIWPPVADAADLVETQR